MTVNVYKPLRSDVRFLRRFTKSNFKNKSFSDKDLIKISNMFLAEGGSWVRVFKDMSVVDFGLLRDTVSKFLKED